MADNDFSLNYQKNGAREQPRKASLHALITQERAQKLDLLVHLIGNLSQSLVICGAQGIGKTRLVKTLQENNGNLWPICVVQGAGTLSFEAVLNQFTQYLIDREPLRAGQDLSTILHHYQNIGRQAVLIVDDAGLLVPGLISALVQYANINEPVRLVLTLTHDDLHIKQSSDSIIDDCHFIEIPPLSKKQCLTFLQNLSAQPETPISFNAATDVLVDNLYSVTHGIPGKILAELPRLAEYRDKPAKNWGGMAGAVFLLLLFALGYYMKQGENQPVDEKPRVNSITPIKETKKITVISEPEVFDSERIENENGPVASKTMPEGYSVIPYNKEPEDDGLFKKEELDDIAIEPPVVRAMESVVEARGETPPVSDATEEIEPIDVADQNAPDANAKPDERLEKSKLPESEPEKPEQSEPPAEKTVTEAIPAISSDAGINWINNRNSDHYTLQLMVLSRKQSVIRLLDKYPDYRESIKYYNSGKDGREKYVLVYGDFVSSAQAETAKKSLPAVFRNAWARKFKVLQAQIAGH